MAVVHVSHAKLMELCFEILFIYSITINKRNGLRVNKKFRLYFELILFLFWFEVRSWVTELIIWLARKLHIISRRVTHLREMVGNVSDLNREWIRMRCARVFRNMHTILTANRMMKEVLSIWRFVCKWCKHTTPIENTHSQMLCFGFFPEMGNCLTYLLFEVRHDRLDLIAVYSMAYPSPIRLDFHGPSSFLMSVSFTCFSVFSLFARVFDAFALAQNCISVQFLPKRITTERREQSTE